MTITLPVTQAEGGAASASEDSANLDLLGLLVLLLLPIAAAAAFFWHKRAVSAAAAQAAAAAVADKQAEQVAAPV
jgi:hypothetical protein